MQHTYAHIFIDLQHWHGFFQAGTAWADGPVGVTQCPIAPGNSFEYRFNAAGQAGTFWYHSHHCKFSSSLCCNFIDRIFIATQYCDGLRGPMVVYDRNDPHRNRYDFDDGAFLLIHAQCKPTTPIRVYHHYACRLVCFFRNLCSCPDRLVQRYHTVAPSAGVVPTPDSTLINGRGRYAGGPTVPLTTIRVLRNRRYRFRLISLSCDPNYVFSIDGHTMVHIFLSSHCLHSAHPNPRQLSRSTPSMFSLTPSTLFRYSLVNATLLC